MGFKEKRQLEFGKPYENAGCSVQLIDLPELVRFKLNGVTVAEGCQWFVVMPGQSYTAEPMLGCKASAYHVYR